MHRLYIAAVFIAILNSDIGKAKTPERLQMLTFEYTQERRNAALLPCPEPIEQRANREDSAGIATKYYGVSGYVDKCQGVKC